MLRISNRLVNFLKIQQKNFAFNESQLPLAKQKQAEKRKEVLAEVHPPLVQKLGMQLEVQQASRNKSVPSLRNNGRIKHARYHV